MEVDIKLNLPLKQILSSLENSILKQIQLTENSIDILSLKEAVAQFQQNIEDQIQQLNSKSDLKALNQAQSEGTQLKDVSSKNVSNNYQPTINNQSKQNLESYYKMQQLKKQKNMDSDSDFNQKSDEISSNSNDDDEDSQGFSSKYNILSPKDKQYITEFFKKHFDPNKRNKMKLVQACQKRINQSFNSIYSMITYLMKRYKQKNKNKSNQRYQENNSRQYYGKSQQQDSSGDIEEDQMNPGLDYSLNEEKESEIIDEESLNNLISKYDFINEKYDSNNFKSENSNSKNYDNNRSANRSQKYREDFQQTQNFEQIRNNMNSKPYENQTKLVRQQQSKETNNQSKVNYNDQRDIAYNSYDESFDNDQDQKLTKKYN